MLRSGSKFAWLLGAIILAWPPTAFAGELSVEIVGAEGPKGEVYVALFDKPELFPKTPLVTKRALAEGGKVVAIFRDVPAGAYAASAFLDENANSVLDRNLMGLPTERFGFSRGAVGRRGAPPFEEARISLGDERQTIVITLR
jgi:uncharacterized protein (DUF2141 family)